MKWYKKALLFLLFAVVLLTVLPARVWAAEDNLRVVSVSTWDELKEALQDQNASKIVVTKDIEFEEAVSLSYAADESQGYYDPGIALEITDRVVANVVGTHQLDLNGKTVRVSTKHIDYCGDVYDVYIGREMTLFRVKANSELIVDDSSKNQDGKIAFGSYIMKAGRLFDEDCLLPLSHTFFRQALCLSR